MNTWMNCRASLPRRTIQHSGVNSLNQIELWSLCEPETSASETAIQTVVEVMSPKADPLIWPCSNGSPSSHQTPGSLILI